MAIDRIPGSPMTPAAPPSAEKKARVSTNDTSSTSASSSDDLQLSTSASALATAANPASSGPDMDKVERIRAQLADGSYKVNPQAIAEALVRESFATQFQG